jgi:hypothetical protein
MARVLMTWWKARLSDYDYPIPGYNLSEGL